MYNINADESILCDFPSHLLNTSINLSKSLTMFIERGQDVKLVCTEVISLLTVEFMICKSKHRPSKK